jgi:phage baseplate assembly protein W
MSEQFIGRGWAYPMRTDPTGGIALVEGEDELAESIRLILGTAYGDRPMRPEFGCAIHDFVFGPADTSMAGLIAYEVNASLLRWEPRIEVVDVQVTLDPEAALAWIDVSYTISDTNDPRNLVYPFYFIPEED